MNDAPQSEILSFAEEIDGEDVRRGLDTLRLLLAEDFDVADFFVAALSDEV